MTPPVTVVDTTARGLSGRSCVAIWLFQRIGIGYPPDRHRAIAILYHTQDSGLPAIDQRSIGHETQQQGENGNPDHEFDRGCPLLSAQKPQCLRAPYSFEQHLPEHANLQFNPILAKQTGIGLVFNDPILRQKHGEWGLSCNGCPDFQGIIFSNRINAAISTDGAPAGAHRRGEMFVRPYRPLER
jgi:hypothetical protein